MSEEIAIGTPVAGENVQPVDTDTEADTVSNAESSDNVAKPAVEQRDGKLYVDGVRVYTRDDTNRIAANAKKEAESKLLSELGVDDFGKVKSVVEQLRDGNQEGGLNIESLRDAVKKREQTVEELRAELNSVRTEMVLKEHISQLQNAMPSQWNADQKSAVIDLMKSRDMLHIDGTQFAIRNGESYLTTDGETPDYASAVQLMGKTLGLPMAKQGVATFDSDRKPTESKAMQGIDEERLRKDAAYRNAYVQVRERNKNLSRSQITDAMVKKYMEGTVRATGAERMLYGSASTQTSAKTTNTRRK